MPYHTEAANAPAAGGTCSDPDPNTQGDADYGCQSMSTAKSGVENQACTSVATCQVNCCEALPASTTNMYFGGLSHGTDWGGVGNAVLNRPEGTKNEKCSDIQCQDCSDPAYCWHGTDSSETYGYLEVDVPSKEGEITSYTTDLWLKCGAGGGQWMIFVAEETNG